MPFPFLFLFLSHFLQLSECKHQFKKSQEVLHKGKGAVHLFLKWESLLFGPYTTVYRGSDVLFDSTRRKIAIPGLLYRIELNVMAHHGMKNANQEKALQYFMYVLKPI